MADRELSKLKKKGEIKLKQEFLENGGQIIDPDLVNENELSEDYD